MYQNHEIAAVATETESYLSVQQRNLTQNFRPRYHPPGGVRLENGGGSIQTPRSDRIFQHTPLVPFLPQNVLAFRHRLFPVLDGINIPSRLNKTRRCAAGRRGCSQQTQKKMIAGVLYCNGLSTEESRLFLAVRKTQHLHPVGRLEKYTFLPSYTVGKRKKTMFFFSFEGPSNPRCFFWTT